MELPDLYYAKDLLAKARIEEAIKFLRDWLRETPLARKRAYENSLILISSNYYDFKKSIQTLSQEQKQLIKNNLITSLLDWIDNFIVLD